MALVLINVGLVANDHTGDPFRTAFQKTNSIITQLNTGGVYMGPFTTPTIGFTVDTGAVGSNASPGILIKGNAGSPANISLAGNGGASGTSSFDLSQSGAGDAFVTLRSANTLNISTSNAVRIFINPTGGITINPPTSNVYGLLVQDNNVGGGNGAIKAKSASSPRIATFDNTQSGGGYIAIERSGGDGGFFGNSGSGLVGGGTIDDYCIRSNAGLDLASGGTNRRIYVDANGSVSIFVPSSGVPLTIKSGTLWSVTNPVLALLGDGGAGAGISICSNGAVPNGQSFDFYQDNAGNATIAQRANATLTFLTNNGTALSLAANHNAAFIGAVGVNSNAPPAQVTGWGAPVGSAVINNYNITDAGGANSNTNKAVAQIIKDLKAFGLYGT